MKRLFGILFLVTAFLAPQAHAGMIPTEGTERERVLSLIERPELARSLESMGIPPAEARERVRAMTDAEVASLAGRLDAAIAAGALSNTDLIIVLLVILLVVVLL